MSRRARNQTTVSLFPFLAVLLCAMGALLVLLVITTRQIRDDALREASVKTLENAEPLPTAVESEPAYEWPDLEVALGLAEELERRLLPTPPPPALLAPKPVFVKRETDPPPPDLTEELQQLRQQIQRASSQLADRRRAAEDIQKRRAALLAEIEKREKVLKNGEQAIAGFQTQQQQLSREVTALEQKSAEMTQELQRLQEEAAAIAEHPRTSPNVLKVVPYDGQQGTTRRPILIECSGNRIRFVPEGIELNERDLVGFSLNNNPLLAGVLAAEKYWMQRNQTEGKLERPYVLLIVRPDGIPAYYAARQLLKQYRQESGYELLTADQNLALPEVDPNAQQAIAQAVGNLLQQRGDTPAVARTPFPQVDPRLLERLRSGQESLAEGSHSRGGSQTPAPGSGEGKHFKWVQTSQGLKMVPIDEPALKRFDTPAESSEKTADGTRSARAGDGSPVASRRSSEPPPLPAPPDGTSIKSLTSEQPDNAQWSRLDSGSRPEGTADADSRGAPQPYDPTRAPDAWTALQEARRDQKKESSTASTSREGHATSRSSADASALAQGLTSPVRGGTLAFKRTIEIRISGTHLRIADRNTFRIPAGISTSQLLSAIALELRREVHSWKRPPEQFYWKPVVKFVVYPGGQQFVERLRPEFEEQGLLSGVQYESPEPASDWRPTQP
jgi:hypothetical protein